MTLPETEKDILFSMLEPHMKSFNIEELINGTPMNKQEMIDYLIKNVFSKHKKKSTS